MNQKLLRFIEKRTDKAIEGGLLYGKIAFELTVLNGQIIEITEIPKASFKVEEINKLTV